MASRSPADVIYKNEDGDWVPGVPASFGIPAAQKGEPNGVAELNAAGDVLDADGNTVGLREVQNQGVDLDARRKLNVQGGARAVDDGSGLDRVTIDVIDERLWLHHVALDNGLTLDNTGLSDGPTCAANLAVMQAAIAQSNAAQANRMHIGVPTGTIVMDPPGGDRVRGDPGRVACRSATILSFRNASTRPRSAATARSTCGTQRPA